MSVTGQILKQACSDGSYVRRSDIYLKTGPYSFPDPPENLLKDGRILKNSRSVVSGFDPQVHFFVKQYRKNGLFRTLKRSLLYPRSFRCLAAALRLRQLGIQTPEVLLASRYCLITEILPDVRFLPECPETAIATLPLLVKMHDGGIRHGDFNLRNLYLTADGAIGVIDLDGSRLYAGPVPEKIRFLELAKLISSYLKNISYNDDELARITADFAADYYRRTRFDFFGPKLLARIRDLAARR